MAKRLGRIKEVKVETIYNKSHDVMSYYCKDCLKLK